MFLAELVVLLLIFIGYSIYEFQKFYKRSDMGKYEHAFISLHKQKPNEVIPLGFGKRDMNLFIHLCKRVVGKRALMDHSPTLETQYIAFRKVVHHHFLAEVVRCDKKYAIIASGDYHCAYILKNVDTWYSKSGYDRSAFNLYAKFCYYKKDDFIPNTKERYSTNPRTVHDSPQFQRSYRSPETYPVGWNWIDDRPDDINRHYRHGHQGYHDPLSQFTEDDYLQLKRDAERGLFRHSDDYPQFRRFNEYNLPPSMDRRFDRPSEFIHYEEPLPRVDEDRGRLQSADRPSNRPPSSRRVLREGQTYVDDQPRSTGRHQDYPIQSRRVTGHMQSRPVGRPPRSTYYEYEPHSLSTNRPPHYRPPRRASLEREHSRTFVDHPQFILRQSLGASARPEGYAEHRPPNLYQQFMEDEEILHRTRVDESYRQSQFRDRFKNYPAPLEMGVERQHHDHQEFRDRSHGHRLPPRGPSERRQQNEQ